MQYFAKDLPGVTFLPDGRKAMLDFTGVDGVGHMATDSGYYVNQINSAIRQGIGGWKPSTQEIYEAELVKKKSQETESSKNPNQRQSKQWFRADPSLARKVAGSVGKKGVEVPISPRPDPIRVPTPEQMKPRKGPIPKEAFI